MGQELHIGLQLKQEIPRGVTITRNGPIITTFIERAAIGKEKCLGR